MSSWRKYVVTTLAVTAGLSAGFAGTAHAECTPTNVEGNGVCVYNYTGPTVGGGDPVTLGVTYCIMGDCHPRDESIATSPTIEDESGPVACVQISGRCYYTIVVPDIPPIPGT